jgi:hypothetical protein
MNIVIPETTKQVLSKTTKMRLALNINEPEKLSQIYSFSLTAGKTCIGATYKKNHKCTKCYAQKGSYSWTPVRTAQDARTKWTVEAHTIGNISALHQWYEVMRTAIHWATIKRNVPFFRIHDSGDFMNHLYVESWIQLATEFSSVQFWSPTSSYPEQAHENVQDFLATLLPHLREFASLPNVALRPSCREMGLGNLIPVDGFAAPTGVIRKKELDLINAELNTVLVCPSSKWGNVCRTCTSCWTEKDLSKYYIQH